MYQAEYINMPFRQDTFDKLIIEKPRQQQEDVDETSTNTNRQNETGSVHFAGVDPADVHYRRKKVTRPYRVHCFALRDTITM